MRTILITGTSRGIGKAAANAFLQADWTVLGTSTSGIAAIEHDRYIHHTLDLTCEQDIKALLESLANVHIDCILNNAAILLEEWDNPAIDQTQLTSTLQINLAGPIQLTEGILKQTPEVKTIINMSSNWGSFSDANFNAYQPHYKISKAAFNMYTKLLAAREPEITVIAFDPGWVQTDMGGMEATTSPEDIAMDLFRLVTTNIQSGQFYSRNNLRSW